jgi:hypothetical protein
MSYLQRTVISGIIIFPFLVTCCKYSVNDRNISAGKATAAYFIDGHLGNDNHPGTRGKPVRTISRLNTLLADNPLSVYFTGGQTYKGTVILKNASGDNNEPLVITSTGSARATINGEDSEAVHIENCSNIYIKDVDLRGNGRDRGNTTDGLSISGSSECKVSDITVKGFQVSGVDLYNCKNISVYNTYAADNGFSGINVTGSDRNSSGNIVIKNCRAENNPGDPAILDNHSGNGILVGMSDSVLVDHCAASDNGWDMPRKGNGPVGIWAWESNRVTIQYCVSYHNKTSEGAKDGGGFDLDGGVTNSVIRYCLSYGNQGAGYGLFQYPGASAWYNNSIQYCVSFNDATTTEGAGSVFIWNGSGDTAMLEKCMVFNNVFYNDAGPVISYEKASAHSKFRFCNNIFVGNGPVVEGEINGSEFLGNDWWHSGKGISFGPYASLKEWAENTGQEMLNGKLEGSTVNPLFEGPLLTDLSDPWKLRELTAFILQSNSPLRGKGINIKLLYGYAIPSEDFYGNSIPEGSVTVPGIYMLK